MNSPAINRFVALVRRECLIEFSETVMMALSVQCFMCVRTLGAEFCAGLPLMLRSWCWVVAGAHDCSGALRPAP